MTGPYQIPLSLHFIRRVLKGQHLGNSAVIKTFIESSQFGCDAGTRLRSGAHMTPDNVT